MNQGASHAPGAWPAPLVTSGLCSHAADRPDGCRRCQQACPRDAIRLDMEPVVGESCVGCGGCVGACPTGSLDGAPLSDAAIVAALDPGRLAAGQAVFACQHAPDVQGATRFPCLGRISDIVLLEALRRGGKHVVLAMGDCETCDLRRAVGALPAAVAVARVVAGAGAIQVTELRPGSALPPDVARHAPTRGVASGPDMGRRELFQFVRRGAARAAATAVEELAHGSAPPPAGRPPGRRDRLAALAVAFGTTESGPLPAGSAFGHVTVSEACFGCNVCEAICPTRALVRRETGDRFSLEVHDPLCTACGLCQVACLDGAIRVLPAERISYRPRLLREIHGGRCAGCGRFSSTGALCRICRSASKGRLRAGHSSP